MKNAFTLAEVMIALVVIGIITSILLPVAYQTVPDENVMKFKKGNATLAKVINELVTSDKYYADGDLGIRANGNLIDGSHDGDYMYLCNTFADVVTVKSKNCSEKNTSVNSWTAIGTSANNSELQGEKGWLDLVCKTYAPKIKEEIITADDIIFFNPNPNLTFGMNEYTAVIAYCFDEDGNVFDNPAVCNGNYDTLKTGRFLTETDENNMLYNYMIYCMDIDGIPDNATADDCVNECPFGYGIRVDGEILTGARADEWLQKDIQDKDE